LTVATRNLPKIPPTRKSKETPCDFTGHLAAGRLKAEGGPTSHIDSIDYLLDRAQAVAEIVKEACQSESSSQLPTESLLLVMDILREDAAVARRIKAWRYGKKGSVIACSFPGLASIGPQ
jgi:hypothetical protein